MKEHLNLDSEFLSNYDNAYIITDFHGRFDLLLKLYDELGISERDLVISLGDNIDRGNESFQLLYYFLETENAISLKGNHEVTFSDAMLNPSQGNEVELLANGGEWAYQYPKGMLKSMAQKVTELPLIVTMHVNQRTIALAHAHIPTLNLDITLNNLNDFSIKKSLTSEFSTLIQRGSVKNADLVVHGHRYVSEPTKVGNRIYIDTGASYLVSGSERNSLTVGHIKLNDGDFNLYVFSLTSNGTLEWEKEHKIDY